jgi:hypothetical protein
MNSKIAILELDTILYNQSHEHHNTNLGWNRVSKYSLNSASSSSSGKSSLGFLTQKLNLAELHGGLSIQGSLLLKYCNS